MKLNQTASSKTVLTGATGAAVTLIVYIGQMFGLEIPVEIATAALTVATFLIAYFVPAKSGRYVITEPLGDEDPNDALIGEEYEDPEPGEVTDPEDDSYVAVEEAK